MQGIRLVKRSWHRQTRRLVIQEGRKMSRIWCIRHGEARGFHNDLIACVACKCRCRKRCKPYVSISLEELASANVEAKRNGHVVFESFPLFEMALSRNGGQ
jgi:hypothetical protein